MADRDKYGNYVNDKGVTIKMNTDMPIIVHPMTVKMLD